MSTLWKCAPPEVWGLKRKEEHSSRSSAQVVSRRLSSGRESCVSLCVCKCKGVEECRKEGVGDSRETLSSGQKLFAIMPGWVRNRPATHWVPSPRGFWFLQPDFPGFDLGSCCLVTSEAHVRPLLQPVYQSAFLEGTDLFRKRMIGSG
ncbi:hypothetical protein HJG60_009473 [Phyllostomus discolor]|uniref:Uncharacterized protein n=1 Tax=Phyllostomus discolor TaxID=89673 RepID=A0A833YG49_9CHIR|nr:hypothetical protein HJG60_009473 [Phyllostomus discolor]